MAEAFLKQTDKSLEVFSAGLNPDVETDPIAIEVMREIGIDISTQKPKSYHLFEGVQVDYLITICDGTRDKISPVNILYMHKIHLGFADPKHASNFKLENIDIYREIRDEIKNELDYFYSRILVKEIS